MSLLDSVRQTISDAATTARDVGQNLGAQAQAQLQLRKLQLDQARKLNELGARTYEWHRAGQLIATGQVPREVSELCNQLDDLGAQIAVETHKLEEAKHQAELRAAKGDTTEAFAPMPDASSIMAAPDTFAAASATTGTIVAPVAATATMPASSTPISSMPTTEPTIIPISTPNSFTPTSSMGANTHMQPMNTSNATMPLTPAPPLAPASMPFPQSTNVAPSAAPSMTLSPMGEAGTYALVPGPDMTPPLIPGTPGPDTSPLPSPPMPSPQAPGPGAPSPLPPSSPIMPPSPGSMPTM